MPVYSPINGMELKATGVDNIYQDTIYGLGYVENNGVLTRMSSPASGGSLVRNSDGTFNDPYIGQTFSFDTTRNAFIPHYIPDETVEAAHIEGDFLVGNETGRRFEIDANGKILTPEEIYYQARHGEDVARIKQMEADGTIDIYLENAKKKNEAVRQKLEKMRRDGTLGDYFKSMLDDNKDKDNDSDKENDHLLDNFERIIAHLGEQSVDTLDELMSYFNAGMVKVGNREIDSYRDPLTASKINARYRALTGEDHPVFVEQILPVIDSYMSLKNDLLQIGGYFNEQYFEDLSNIQVYVNSKYPKKEEEIEATNETVVKPVQMSYAEKLRQEHKKYGVEFPDIYYEVAELEHKAANNELTAADLKKMCDMTFGVDTPESQLIYDAMIQTGRVAPPEQTDELTSEGKTR